MLLLLEGAAVVVALGTAPVDGGADDSDVGVGSETVWCTAEWWWLGEVEADCAGAVALLDV